MIDMEDIKHAVAVHYHISVEDLCSPRRLKTLVEARAAFCAIARKLTPASLNEIGAQLSGRHHTSVMNALSVARREAIQREIHEIEGRLSA